MRKVFWQMMVSLDGFMEGPDRELDWHVVDEDFALARYVADRLLVNSMPRPSRVKR